MWVSYIRGVQQGQPLSLLLFLRPPDHQAAGQLTWKALPIGELLGCGGEFWPVPPRKTLRTNAGPLSRVIPLKSEGGRVFIDELLSHLLMGWKDKVDSSVVRESPQRRNAALEAGHQACLLGGGKDRGP